MLKIDNKKELSQQTISDGLRILSRIIAREESSKSIEIQYSTFSPRKKKNYKNKSEIGGIRNAG